MRLAKLLAMTCVAACIAGVCLAEVRDKNKDGIPDGQSKKAPPHQKAPQPKKPPKPKAEHPKKPPAKAEQPKKQHDKAEQPKKQQHEKAAPAKRPAQAEKKADPPKKKPKSDAGPKPSGDNKDAKKKDNNDHKEVKKKAAAASDAPKESAAKPAKKDAPASSSADVAKSDEAEQHAKKHKKALPADDKSEKPLSARHHDVDWREAHQQKRIAFGIRNGSLTKAEVVSLEKREMDIRHLEASFRSDGHLSVDERKQLHAKLDDASRMIFAGKHDTDGWHMPALRFGVNVFVRREVLVRIEHEHFSGAAARGIAADYHRLLALHRRLGYEMLAVALREELLREYNDLLYQYFEVRSS